VKNIVVDFCFVYKLKLVS